MKHSIIRISNLFILTILSLLIFSCGASRQFKTATTLGTIQAYEKFIEDYPKSSKAPIAAVQLKSLYENRDWESAKRINSSSAYQNFLSAYPNSLKKNEAKRLLEKAEQEEKILAEWNKVQNINTIDAYERFLIQYPGSKYSSNARNAINGFIDKAWREANNQNSIEGYQNFLKTHPNSSYTQQANREMNKIKDTNAWRIASSKNSISAFEDYLIQFPSGLFSTDARTKIKIIEEEKYILPAWNRALSQNTYQGYMSFYRLYPNSSYASQAKYKAEGFENTDWYKARNQNTIAGYNSFISKYPSSDRAEEARKNIIDLEVENIFRGEHGYLPPMNKISSYGYGQSKPTTNTIEIYNDTAYELTVWYSGSTSKKIVLNPRRSTTFTLPNGPYKVAASVKASNVTKYAGNENLTGGSYESKFYIESRYGF